MGKSFHAVIWHYLTTYPNPRRTWSSNFVVIFCLNVKQKSLLFGT